MSYDWIKEINTWTQEHFLFYMAFFEIVFVFDKKQKQ